MFFPVFPIWRTIIYITTDVLLLFDDLVWQVTMDEELRTIGGNTIERGTTCDGTISQQQQINSGKQQKAQALLFWSHKSLSHRHHSCLRLEFQTSQCTRRSSGNLEGMGSCSPHFFTGTMVGGLSTHLTTCEESPPPHLCSSLLFVRQMCDFQLDNWSRSKPIQGGICFFYPPNYMDCRCEQPIMRSGKSGFNTWLPVKTGSVSTSSFLKGQRICSHR